MVPSSAKKQKKKAKKMMVCQMESICLCKWRDNIIPLRKSELLPVATWICLTELIPRDTSVGISAVPEHPI
jgi:hypothetical protein